jgi:hypothetical protein
VSRGRDRAVRGRRPAVRGRGPRLLAALGLAALLAALLPTLVAASDGHTLTGFGVIEEMTWQPRNSFTIQWDRPPDTAAPVNWAIRDRNGQPIPGEGTNQTSQPAWGGIQVPGPGAYQVEAWEPGGPAVRAWMLFDDVPPEPIAIHVPSWVAAGGQVPIDIDRPAPPLPPSGVVGYATSLDDSAAATPCARAGLCAQAEVDLRGGVGDQHGVLPAPSEGVYYVHVAAVSSSGVTSQVATARVGVDGTPPTVALEGVPAGWAPGPVRVTAAASDPLSGMTPAGPGGPITALAVDGGPTQVEPGPTITRTITGEGVHEVSFYGRDAVGNAGDGSRPFSHPGTATVRIDESGPSVRFAASDPADPERIEATVADALSGPDPDRGQIEVAPPGGTFRPLPTTVGRGRLVARWNSDDFPHGAYEFRATGYDAAGNAASSTLGPGGAPFVLTDPVKREARLAFGFGGARLVIQRCVRAAGSRRCHNDVVRPFAKRPAARTMPCCHGALVGGRLLDPAGAPLGGQTVEVVETLARGAANGTRRTALVTDADGRFATRLAPGPSRQVTAVFPGTSRLTRAAGRRVRLRVRAAIRMKVSATHAQVGGAPVVFSGRIAHPEARLPARGLPVELEFRLPGLAWAQFRTVETDAEGRFHFPYEFSDDDSVGVRFQFRAFLPAAGDWPFAPATSRPLAVTG